MDSIPSDVHKIRAGWLIDGTGCPALKDVLIEFKGERIFAIRPSIPSLTETGDIFDHRDCTLIPGLIDSHVHIFMSGTEDMEIRKHQLEAEFSEARNVISMHLKQHLSFGVVGVRDGGDHFAHALCYKLEKDSENLLPIILHTAGRAWHKAGRYGSLIGRPTTGNETLAEGIVQNKHGIDHVKIVNSGINSLIRFGKETLPQFGLGELKDAVGAAKQIGLPVMVHSNGRIPTQIAVAAGCRSIEHGFFMGKENMERMRDENLVWIPTACTMKAFADPMRKGFLISGISRDVSQRTLDHQMEQIQYAGRIGLTIAVGTDSGSIGVHHGRSIMDELSILVDAGFSIEEAICCAARNGARLLGIDNLGWIAPGKSATFAVVMGNPSQLPQSLERICALYIRGVNYPGQGFFCNSG